MNIENELYGRYQVASDDEKQQLAVLLYAELVQHALSVSHIVLGASPPALAHKIATKIFRLMDTFEGRSAFSTWVHRIAINDCKMWLRKKSNCREISLIAAEGLFTSEDPEMRVYLRELFDNLPLSDQHLIEWKLDGYTDKEIAERLDISRGGAAVKWSRLRKRLRKELNCRNV